ncbi:MAG: DUF4160 domain-containing protein [Spirochaetia bacterium]|nr:DUF4160 domain-containing protein [Spirochaetia bacterium]
MPKYFRDKIADHYLYFTAKCIVEAMHVHASDKKLTEADSAKFFVKADGTAVLQKRGDLTDSQISTIEKFIKANYVDMYKTWKDFGGGEFYGK